MDEQEILAALREHVARSQNNGTRGEGAKDPYESRVDTSALNQLTAELWILRNGVGRPDPRKSGLSRRAAQALKKLIQRSLTWYTRSLQRYHDGVNQTFDFHARAIVSLQEQMLRLDGGLPELLQEMLRADKRAIQEQQAPYAELFRGLSPVLDLGCGRGDFLEVLKKKAISAYGVDSDHLACEEARYRSLMVVQSDLFEYLIQIPDRSLGGIFCSRVVEYLPAHLQAQLISCSADKLKPGGLLVLETINPDSDTPFGRNSHIDPTHLRAIYPETLKSMVESNGFDHCKICVLAPQQVSVAAGSDNSDATRRTMDNCEFTAPPAVSRAPAYAAIANRE